MRQELDIKPELIRWAINRAGVSADSLYAPGLMHVVDWQTGEKKPTLTQLKNFAKKLHVPLGYLFLAKPPEEKIPVPDYRTFDDDDPKHPSPDLIETLHEMQRRQEWMRDYLIEVGADTLPFVGSLSKVRPETASIRKAAEQIRNDLGLSENWTAKCRNFSESCRLLRNAFDETGVLVSMSKFVGVGGTHRPFNSDEFCGFVLPDDYAPLIFVNRQITLSAQIFTLVHEAAHIWMGIGGLFNHSLEPQHSRKKNEQICNQIAAEFLVPESVFIDKWKQQQEEDDAIFNLLAASFKVSPIVIARRALDLKLIDTNHFYGFWHRDREEWENRKLAPKKPKGTDEKINPYPSYRLKLGRRFSEAVISATRSGSLSYRDAFRLTGLYGQTFDKYAQFVTKRTGGDFE